MIVSESTTHFIRNDYMEHIENHLIYVIFTRKKIKVSLPCVLYPKFHVL